MNTRTPNHTPFIIVAIFAAVATGLVALMYLMGASEHVNAFTGFFLTVFVGLTGFATAVYQLGRTDQKLEAIQANTNGTLSALRNEKAQLEAQILQSGQTPITTGATPAQ